MEKLKNVNFALVAFIAFAVRMVAMGASISEALVMLVLAGLYGYDKWLNKSSDTLKEEQRVQKMERDIADLKSTIASIKLGAASAGIRKLGG